VNKSVNPGSLYLDVKDVAARYAVSTDTIWRWARTGQLPRPVRIGPNTTRWRLLDLDAHDSTLRSCFETVLLSTDGIFGRAA